MLKTINATIADMEILHVLHVTSIFITVKNKKPSRMWQSV